MCPRRRRSPSSPLAGCWFERECCRWSVAITSTPLSIRASAVARCRGWTSDLTAARCGPRGASGIRQPLAHNGFGISRGVATFLRTAQDESQQRLGCVRIQHWRIIRADDVDRAVSVLARVFGAIATGHTELRPDARGRNWWLVTLQFARMFVDCSRGLSHGGMVDYFSPSPDSPQP